MGRKHMISSMSSPIFVLGAQRTGSTLIGRMLAALPESAITINGKVAYYLFLYIPTTPTWWQWIEHLRTDEILHALSRKPPIQAPDRFNEHVVEGLRLGRLDLLGLTDRPTRRQAIAHLTRTVYTALAPQARLWGDKYNEYVLQLDDLHGCFPDARWVWTVREAA